MTSSFLLTLRVCEKKIIWKQDAMGRLRSHSHSLGSAASWPSLRAHVHANLSPQHFLLWAYNWWVGALQPSLPPPTGPCHQAQL